ncbi:Subtilisin-like protease 8 [Smittium mucronatum]|uniref:Subtilisin-like protease 8 n=1 Tax=Smittium mucronatum TaxID=133383 RepID=A0A1R0H8S9_9FUNG|nr:Subtilisin-like protease 8 [Smittium mucronatum]
MNLTRTLKEYRSLVGYCGVFEKKLIEIISFSKEVEYIERDQIVSASSTQNDAPWGLARISHRETLNSTTIGQYIYDPSAGEGVDVYVLDTGIYLQHLDFGGRATWGENFSKGQNLVDLNGHGTFIAGVIGSNTYGVAKKSNLISVKVLNDDGTGYIGDAIAGIQFTISEHISKKALALSMGTALPKSIANLGLESGLSQAFNSAVSAAVAKGIPYIVAAGNAAIDACLASPASTKSVIAVGSIGKNDYVSAFSNYGVCVDIYAPGESTKSTWIGSNSATSILSGTSTSAPYISGLAAYILSQRDYYLTPRELLTIIQSTATMNIVKNLEPLSPNMIAYNSPPLS